MQSLTRLRLAIAATAFTLLPLAHADVVLLEQAPLQQADAAANGTDGQAPSLAETFVFEGIAHSLAWWGTQNGGFQIDLYQGNTKLLGTQLVGATQAGFSIDIDGGPREIYVYSIDVASLAAGSYTLAVSDIGSDAQGASWYWLHGSGGDGRSISGLGERDQTLNTFDLSLRVVGEGPHGVPAPSAAWLMLAAAALLGARRTWRWHR